MITLSAIHCSKCEDIIYSCARHDFMKCTCGSYSIDGGFDYLKVSFPPDSSYDMIHVEVDATKQELYNDYNTTKKRKYGLIPKGRFRKYEKLHIEPLNMHEIN